MDGLTPPTNEYKNEELLTVKKNPLEQLLPDQHLLVSEIKKQNMFYAQITGEKVG